MSVLEGKDSKREVGKIRKGRRERSGHKEEGNSEKGEIRESKGRHQVLPGFICSPQSLFINRASALVNVQD